MGSHINDGGIKFVRQTVTTKDVSNADTTYVCKTGSLNLGASRITQRDENDVENAQAGSSNIKEGSVTLQFIDPADKAPKQFAEMTLEDTSGNDVTVIIWEVSEKFGSAEAAMVELKVYEKQAAPVTP